MKFVYTVYEVNIDYCMLAFLFCSRELSPHVILRNYASKFRLRAVIPTRQLCNAVCKCTTALEHWTLTLYGV